jgi:hypothetical protein
MFVVPDNAWHPCVCVFLGARVRLPLGCQSWPAPASVFKRATVSAGAHVGALGKCMNWLCVLIAFANCHVLYCVCGVVVRLCGGCNRKGLQAVLSGPARLGVADVRCLNTVTTSCAERTGAAERESLWRDRSGGLTSPALHACGSLSPLSARTNSARVHPPPLRAMVATSMK